MALKLESQCQAAVDLAKRALPDGAELGAEVLLSSLYHHGNLKSKYPALEHYLPQPANQRPNVPEKVSLTPALRPIFQNFADREKPVSADELFRALVECDAGRQLLNRQGLSDAALVALLAPLPPKQTGWRGSAARLSAIQALSSYGRMLTETEPPHGKVVGNETTLKAIIRTLSKMKRRNAIIIGHPGTGKSAIIYELARRIFHGDGSLPVRLRDMDIFELSPAFLRSGASMVGQYEERVKGLIKVLTEHPQVILFVDEIHSLFQAGIYERGPFSDANESFKGVLGRGEITCIGCTTPAEYRHAIAPDKALERRFSIIRLEPPSRAETLAILQARRPQMEEYFSPLRIPDAVLEKAIDLTDDFLPGRFQPDKSIQLLDEACAFCATDDQPKQEVTETILAQALEDMIGHSIVRAQNLTEDQVYQSLAVKIIGQDEALRELARAFVAALGSWAKGHGPRGVFLFGGPTGVGKTETALLLSRVMGGGQDSLIRVDCNTLQGSVQDSGPAINRLLGIPPGYLGYARGQGGILSRIRDLPECIVLFDEFEKATPGVGKLLLQIIDDGRIEDVDGNMLDFRRAFIIFTTNVGTVYDRRLMGFNPGGPDSSGVPQVDVDLLKRELRALGLGEEFLGRISHILLFRGLQGDAVRRILEGQLADLRHLSELRGLQLSWQPDLISHLASRWQPRFGVRFLNAILRHRIIEQLGVAEAQGELKGVKNIALELIKTDKDKPDENLAGLARRRRDSDTLILSLA